MDEELRRLREAVADFCERMAGQFADGRFNSAAGMLRGKRAGRRAVDDDKALAYARGLHRMGLAKSKHRACLRAAELYAPPHQVESMVRRLTNKFSDETN